MPAAASVDFKKIASVCFYFHGISGGGGTGKGGGRLKRFNIPQFCVYTLGFIKCYRLYLYLLLGVTLNEGHLFKGGKQSSGQVIVFVQFFITK